MTNFGKRGKCKSCVVSAICLSSGDAGLRETIHSICLHCGKVRLRNNKDKPVDLNCGWFDTQYLHRTMRGKTCEECKIEIQEMLEISGGKDARNNDRGSEQRRRK